MKMATIPQMEKHTYTKYIKILICTNCTDNDCINLLYKRVELSDMMNLKKMRK